MTKNFIFVLLLASTCLPAVTARGQGRYEYRGQVFKLMPFFTDYQEPDRHFRSPRMRNLRNQVDLAGLQTEVKNQGQRGSCAYFAAMALTEHAVKRLFAGEKDLNFSEEYLIYYTKAILNQSSLQDGSFVSSNLKAINQGGLLLEEHLPYSYSWFLSGMPCEYEDEDNCSRVECFAHRGPASEQAAQLVQPADFELYLASNCTASGCSDKLDWIIASLNDDKAVALSLPLHQEGWNGTTGQASYSPEQAQFCRQNPNDSLCGGHAILLTGYDLPARTFRFKNSWGSDWGQSGYGTIDFEYVDNYSRKDSIHAASMTGLDPEIGNQPSGTETLENAAYRIEPGFASDGQPGVFIRMTYEYLAPLGSFYYASVFAVTGDSGSYTPISFTDSDGNLQYVAARHYGIALTPEDLLRTDQNPLELFLPYSMLDQSGVSAEDNIFLRPSFYRMSDTASYVILFREYEPFTWTTPDPCNGETWEGRCDGDTVIWCENQQIHTQDCAASGRQCVWDEEKNYYACR